MDLNKAMIIGRLTQNPEVRTTPQGTSVCSFSIATNFVWTDAQGKQQERVEYHNIVAWRKLGEICGQYLSKGRRVYIEGRIQTRSWQDQNGVKRNRTEIVTDNMIMLDGRGAPQSGDGPSLAKEPAPAQDATPIMNEQPAVQDQEIKVENIPF